RRRRRIIWAALILCFVVPPLVVGAYVWTLLPTLPDPRDLKDVTYKVPLRIETQDGQLITEIGTQKRLPLDYNEIPQLMTQAIISAEDDNFFEHGGVDYMGIGRAVFELITTGSKQSGGSTITMQVARNFFLSRERTFLRKFNEIVLSYKIEHYLSKQEILALYLNKIFLGYRSYGAAAAAQTYYGKPIDELALNEYAMIAGLPKAPSHYNPIYDPERAMIRRNYVLRQMHKNGYITDEQFETAKATPVHAKLTGARIDIEAGYIAELARRFALEQFGEQALENGLTIVTTVDSQLQGVANQALRQGLQAYERRHGYRGPSDHLSPSQMSDQNALLERLDEMPVYGDLLAAAVTATGEDSAELLLENGESTTLSLEDLSWAKPFISVNKTGSKPEAMNDVLSSGDLVYVHQRDQHWQLAQNPKVEGALISVNARTGAIQALVGGYDYFKSKYNRVTQAKRQVGSNIKPFLYSSALEEGMTVATVINDAPVVFQDRNLEATWKPENYSGRFYGPTRLRKALAYSRNLVSIRLLQRIGVNAAADYFRRFGFPEPALDASRNLSLALGTVQLTPQEVVRGYATFANGGYRIEPYLIDRVRDFNGDLIYQANPKTACQYQCEDNDPAYAPRTITPQNAYLVTSMMQDVIAYGSGRKAKQLGRDDIAGKTGTTNNQVDAWFSGFNPHIATTVWVGFDSPTTLGRSEVGGRAALPIWIDYMKAALEPYANTPIPTPPGLVNIPIDPNTGQAVPADTAGAVFEIFREDNAPEIPSVEATEMEKITQELFQ
ncbi:MAG: penicillin-binding protein 1A, partial [Hydrogenovibrio sp.]|uniref:penicillin-binding protein 1A n=1 Tax=Hydrogenovibrio sp. TaxID=2065821 RepID=UPI00287050DD